MMLVLKNEPAAIANHTGYWRYFDSLAFNNPLLLASDAGPRVWVLYQTYGF